MEVWPAGYPAPGIGRLVLIKRRRDLPIEISVKDRISMN